MQVKKRENESVSSLIYRFTKRIQQTGVLREARKRRFKKRTVSKNKRRVSALHREEKKQEYKQKKKMGVM